MSKFGATVLSVSHFDNGACAILVKVTAVDGRAIEAMLVDIRREDAEVVKALEEKGLASRAQITFEGRSILEWQEGVDRMLPAKDKYPAQKIHSLLGYQPGSIEVVRWTKAATLVDETDEVKANYSRRLTVATKLDAAVSAVKSAVKNLLG
jgi:hypothetical protein